MFAIATGQPIELTVPAGYTDEQVRDTIGVALAAGAGITVTVNDPADTITIASTISQYTDEQARDVIGLALLAGAGITITVNDPADTITISTTISQYTDEMVDDRVAALIQNGTGITWSYNDAAGTLTPTVTITQYTDEMARDAIGAALVGSASISITVNDAGDTITLAVPANGISYSLIQDITATSRIICRKTAGAGDPEEGTLSEILDFIGSAGQGDIIYRGAATWSRLAAGAAGQLLTAHGAANLTWENPAASAALPAFIFRNRIENGDFHIDSSKNGGVYSGITETLDNWWITSSGVGVFTAQRVADPDDATKFALKFAVTTIDASIGATDGYSLYYEIDNSFLLDLLIGTANAKQITISFDMKFSVAGSYGISFRNAVPDRSFVGVVTQLVANATESKTLTLTLDTAGTWNNAATGLGAYFTFVLAAGSNRQGTAGSWQAANITTTAAQANFLSSVANIGYLKNIQIERGATATVFDYNTSDGFLSTDAILSRDQPFRNRLCNGDFKIDQINEGAVYSIPASSAVQAVDNWTGDSSGVGVFSLQRVADPDNPSLFALKVSCTTIDAAIAAGDVYRIQTSIEGVDVADLKSGSVNAAQITLSFEMKFSVAGVYGVGFRNAAGNRYYPAFVTQLVANATEFKTITLTLDTTGTWASDNTKGLSILFILAGGTDWQGTAGAWVGAGTPLTTAAQVNFMSNVANVGYLKNFQVEKGPVATPFEYLSRTQALARCQRYYEKSYNQGVAVGTTPNFDGCIVYKVQIAGVATGYGVTIPFAVHKRTTPTVVCFNPAAANGNWRNQSGATDSGTPGGAAFVGASSMEIENVQTIGEGAGNRVAIHWTANARLT